MSIEGACSACRVTHDHGRRDWPSADHRTGPPAFALVRVPLIFGRREQPLGRVAGKAEEESIAELSATMTTQPDADRVARSRLKTYETPLNPDPGLAAAGGGGEGVAAMTVARTDDARARADELRTPEPLATPPPLPQGLGYRTKVALLGPPLTREAAPHQRLSKKLALGVLSSDCISSSAYGTEEMLIILLPVFGIAGFTILLPLTGVILAVLTIVTLSYRDVVTVYTRTGGSYVVARENFGPTVAQVAAVALMLDYIVTVAIQSAAGTAAITSAVPALSHLTLAITVGWVLVMFYGNLR